MAHPDREAVEDAKKALTVIFIILITIANASLFFKVVRIPKFLYKPKCLTLISLAIGDIVLALFPLVIMARLAFGDDLSLSCSTIISANVHMTYLLTFVYGMGLTVLAVELIIRRRNRAVTGAATSPAQMVKSFVVGAVPWILGLIIILPLTMAGTDWDYCRNSYTLPRQRAMWVISVIIPACLALLVAIFVVCTTPQYLQHPQELQFSHSPSVQTTYSQPPINNYHNPQNTEHIHPPPQNFQATSSPYVSLPVNPYNNQYNSQTNTSQPYAFQSTPTFAPTVVSNSNVDHASEKSTLLGVSIVYFICVVPLAGYILHFLSPDSTSDLDPLGLTIVSMVVQWLSILRSFVTPIIWIQSSAVREI